MVLYLYSQHAGNKLIDEVLTVAENTAVSEGVSLLFPAFSGGVELDRPEEVVGCLEVGAAGSDLVDKVFHAVDSLFAELTSDDGVVGQGDSGSVDLTAASLVDELLDGRPGGVSIGDERLNHADHVDSGFGQTDEHTVVDLSESQELHDLLGLGGKFVDTIERIRLTDY